MLGQLIYTVQELAIQEKNVKCFSKTWGKRLGIFVFILPTIFGKLLAGLLGGVKKNNLVARLAIKISVDMNIVVHRTMNIHYLNGHERKISTVSMLKNDGYSLFEWSWMKNIHRSNVEEQWIFIVLNHAWRIFIVSMFLQRSSRPLLKLQYQRISSGGRVKININRWIFTVHWILTFECWQTCLKSWKIGAIHKYLSLPDLIYIHK